LPPFLKESRSIFPTTLTLDFASAFALLFGFDSSKVSSRTRVIWLGKKGASSSNYWQD
jgi:hypothetical protein